jgi:hypothetical protein
MWSFQKETVLISYFSNILPYSNACGPMSVPFPTLKFAVHDGNSALPAGWIQDGEISRYSLFLYELGLNLFYMTKSIT